jgi:inositol-hexakisphosphate 5-kinase
MPTRRDGALSTPKEPESVPGREEGHEPSAGAEKIADEDEDDYESDKEHISSATYYPHQSQVPSSPEASEREQAELPKDHDDKQELDVELPPQALELEPLGREASADSAGAALALQSKNKILSINADFIEQRGPSEPSRPARTRTWSTTSSTSDTEYESWDDATRSEREDSGITDGDVTPTATPRTQDLSLRPKSRRAPLGAVELQPYKHQVGGHTKVFSFSRQAICKQLNNRENEFYEVIERKHPELLKFLPRYVSAPLDLPTPNVERGELTLHFFFF